MIATPVRKELVLCVPSSRVDSLGVHEGFNHTDDSKRWLADLLFPGTLAWIEREQAERDPSWRQLIPYAVIRNDDWLFSYRRGGGGEGRLEGRRSIGVGGHIERVDVKADDPSEWYAEGLARELWEETEGVFGMSLRFHASRVVGVVRDDSNEVGRVHLGVVHEFETFATIVHSRDRGVTDAGLRPIHSIRDDLAAYEGWSRLVFETLYPAPAEA